MGLKNVLLDPSVQCTIKRQQSSKELSRIIGDHDGFTPELKLSKCDKPSPTTIGKRVKLRKQANILYTIPSPPKPKIIIRTPTKGTGLKILTAKEMLQRLAIALALANTRTLSIY